MYVVLGRHDAWMQPYSESTHQGCIHHASCRPNRVFYTSKWSERCMNAALVSRHKRAIFMHHVNKGRSILNSCATISSIYLVMCRNLSSDWVAYLESVNTILLAPGEWRTERSLCYTVYTLTDLFTILINSVPRWTVEITFLCWIWVWK